MPARNCKEAMTPDLFDYLIAAALLVALAVWFDRWWRK
jgi:hypothetical protein